MLGRVSSLAARRRGEAVGGRPFNGGGMRDKLNRPVVLSYIAASGLPLAPTAHASLAALRAARLTPSCRPQARPRGRRPVRRLAHGAAHVHRCRRPGLSDEPHPHLARQDRRARLVALCSAQQRRRHHRRPDPHQAQGGRLAVVRRDQRRPRRGGLCAHQGAPRRVERGPPRPGRAVGAAERLGPRGAAGPQGGRGACDAHRRGPLRAQVRPERVRRDRQGQGQVPRRAWRLHRRGRL